MRKFVFCLFCVLLIAPAALAQTSDSGNAPDALPPVINDGLELYKTHAPDAMITTWIKGGPLEGNRDAYAQIGFLRQVQDLYGVYQGYEVVVSQTLSQRTEVFYLVMHYEKGPLFAKFVVYKARAGWVVTSFNLSKDDTILPQPDVTPPPQGNQ
ncbi:MAG: hypothetical protein FWD64_05585 [Acidobacteriaceae bacterium]|nr:hypothetical protein [Acidobacteriaceae bacterium]